MSRGVVVWPDPDTERVVREIWADLGENGLPSAVSGAPHGHRPHLSFIVADAMEVDQVLAEVGCFPASPIEVLIESLAVDKAGHLLLNITPTAELLREQARIHSLSVPFAERPWPHYVPGRWLPHMTLGRSLSPAELSLATELVTTRLPIQCLLATGGVEDGTTGDRWQTTAVG